MNDDAELLRQYFEEGSEAAFRELVERYVNLVFGAALRRTGGDAHRAQDIVQSVFIALARRAPGLVRHPSLAGWLFTATRNTAINAGIAEKRRQARELAAGSIEALNAAPTDSVDWNQLRLVLDEALDDLPSRDREVVLLRFYQGRTSADVSLRLGIRENAVRMRIERALEKLRHSLRKRGVVSTSSGLATAMSAYGNIVAPSGLASSVAATALSAAAQGAVGLSVFGALTFMSGTKTILTAAAIAVVGILAYDWVTFRTAAAQAVGNEGGRSESAQLARRANVLGRQLETLDRQSALIADAQAVAKPGSDAAAPAANAFVSPTRPYLSDPTYRALYAIAQQARFHMEFQDLYRELGVSPEVAEKFEAVMVEQSLASQDGQIARDLGLDEQVIYKQSGPIWAAGVTELLGAQGKKRLEVYLRSRTLRTFVNSLATLTYPLNDPITPEQAARVTAIALENDPIYQSGIGTGPNQPNWPGVWSPAATVLSPEQLTALQTMVESMTLKRQIQETLVASPMKKSSSPLLLGSVAIGILIAVYFHFRIARQTDDLRAANRATSEKLSAQRRELAELTRRVDAARAHYRSLLEQSSGEKTPGIVVTTTNPAPSAQPDVRNARIGASPALRQASVQAYVDDRKLAFGGLLKRLGLTPDQLERFDAIQAEYQNRMLDLAVAANERPANPELAEMRREVRQREDDAYRDLFGAAYPQWREEVNNLGSRQVVNSIVQSTFSGSGALSGFQADQLTALLERSKSVESGRTQYDWEGIFRGATPLLSPEQLDGFKSGVEYYLANAEMVIIAANATKK